MFTEKNRKITTLSKSILKRTDTLRILRNISQCHYHPMKWARQVYVGAGVKVSKTGKATKQIAAIFKHFDPISRIIDHSLPFDRGIKLQVPTKERIKKLEKIKNELKILGYSDKIIKSIVSAAIASAKAISLFLQEAT